jgi:hypothetical protein
MKRILMLMMVALVMFGVSGQAMASFNDGDLLRVVYQGAGAGQEYVTDLGAFSTLTSPITSNNPLTGQDTFSLSSVGAGSWSNVQVAYFIVDLAGNGGTGAVWTSGGVNGGYHNSGALASFTGAGAVTYNSWQTNSGGANSLAQSQSVFGSYWNWLNNAQSGAPDIGGMGSYLLTPASSAEANLANLATTGYVDQVLYYYGSNPDGTARGTALGTIRTMLNGTGSTQLLASTPIPAAAYLFGSGLLGMFGLRRKMAVKGPEIG